MVALIEGSKAWCCPSIKITLCLLYDKKLIQDYKETTGDNIFR